MRQEPVPSYLSEHSSFVSKLRDGVDAAEGPIVTEWLRHYGVSGSVNPKEAVNTADKGYQERTVPASTPFTWKTDIPILPGMNNPMSRFLKETASRNLANKESVVGSEAWQEVMRTAIPCLHDETFLQRLRNARQESEVMKTNYDKHIYDLEISRKEQGRLWEDSQQAAQGSHASENKYLDEIREANQDRFEDAWRQWARLNLDISHRASNSRVPEAHVLASFIAELSPELKTSFLREFPTYQRPKNSELHQEKELENMENTYQFFSSLKHAWDDCYDSDMEESSEATGGQKTAQSDASISPTIVVPTMASSERNSQS